MREFFSTKEISQEFYKNNPNNATIEQKDITMEKHIELDGTYMNVIQFGKGKKNLSIIAGVSLTGLEGLGEALENAFSIFLDEFTVYVFDRKKDLPEIYSIDEMAEDVYKCLRILGVDHTSVYGASQGGMIGQVLAINHPELVENLIVCSTICRINNKPDDVIKLWIEAAKAHDIEKVNMLFLEYVYSQSFIDSIKDNIPVLIKNGTDRDCDRFVTILKAILSFDVYDSLDKIQCPVLVLGDVNDKIFDSKCAYEIADKLKCQIYLYDKYSHAVYDEAPDLKQRIFDFICSGNN